MTTLIPLLHITLAVCCVALAFTLLKAALLINKMSKHIDKLERERNVTTPPK